MTEETSLLSNYHFWYAVDVVLFLILAWYLGRKPMLGMIDAEIAKVRAELEEAKKLRAEAAATLMDYRARQQAALAEADKIIHHAKEEAARLRGNAEAELKAALERYENKAAERIRMAEAEAVDEVRTAVIEEAVTAARKALAAHLDAPAAKRLADQAIAEVSKLKSTKNKVA